MQYISDGEAIEVGVIDPDDEEETYRREQALVPRPLAGSELQFRVISGYILRGSGGDICILAICNFTSCNFVVGENLRIILCVFCIFVFFVFFLYFSGFVISCVRRICIL